METKHTPGPWEFQPHDKDSRYYGNIVGYYSKYETDPEKGNQIRTITIQLKHGTDEENKANAELIAQAPDLLAKVSEQEAEISKLKGEAKLWQGTQLGLQKELAKKDQKVSEQEKEIDELKAWKKSEMKLWGPLIEYAQTHQSELGLKLGESISDKILQFLKDRTEIRKALKSITLSMKAHPDCTEGNEFADMVSIAEKALKTK